MPTPAKKAAPVKKAAEKKVALGNPDEAAAHATRPKPSRPKPSAADAYQQLALEWALREAFDPVAWPHARHKIEKTPMPDEVRQVLLERVDLMG